MEITVLAEEKLAHMYALLIAPGKFGKTTALATLPKPLLIGDADGGIRSLLKKSVVPPEAAKQIFVADLKSYADAQEFFTHSWKQGPGGKPFASIAMDTFSWMLNYTIRGEILAMSKREKMELQDWGLYLERGMAIAKLAHQLALREDGCHVVLACHEADKGDEGNTKLGPAISGQLFDILPGMPDFVFFLRIRPTGKFDAGRPIVNRVFQTAADQRTPAGARIDMPDFIPADFGKLWEGINK